MADVRVTRGGMGVREISHAAGTPVGIGINTFAIRALRNKLTGRNLVPILKRALRPALQQAQDEWPVLTGASRDSIRLQVAEISEHTARVALTAGGPQLMEDERNKSGKDYAPFIEFNGTATAPAGILTSAVETNYTDIVDTIHEGVNELINE